MIIIVKSFLIMKIKRKFYRNLESVLRKFIIFQEKNKKNTYLQKAVQSAIYNTSPKGDVIFLNKNKQKYLVHTSDTISKKLFIDYNFDFKIIKKALKFLDKNNKRKTLLNVGANIGSICIKSVKEKLFNSAIVFEPAKSHFRLLVANIFINKLENKIKAHQLALSDKKKILKLSLNQKGNLGDNRILKKTSNKKNLKIEKVKSDKLDNFTSKLNKKNSLIFMDVQGHEPYVLKGGKKTIKKKIPIVLEFSPLLLDKNWIKNFELLFRNYKYFYDLHKNKSKKILNKQNLTDLFNNLKHEKNNYTDLLIV